MFIRWIIVCQLRYRWCDNATYGYLIRICRFDNMIHNSEIVVD